MPSTISMSHHSELLFAMGSQMATVGVGTWAWYVEYEDPGVNIQALLVADSASGVPDAMENITCMTRLGALAAAGCDIHPVARAHEHADVEFLVDTLTEKIPPLKTLGTSQGRTTHCEQSITGFPFGQPLDIDMLHWMLETVVKNGMCWGMDDTSILPHNPYKFDDE